MKAASSLRFFAALAAVAALALGASGAAQAQGVYWSIGISSPGVDVTVSQPAPVYLAPPPVYYVQPQPIYIEPEPVYVVPRPVYMPPRQVVVAPRWVEVNYGAPQWRGGHHHGHRGYERREDFRHERYNPGRGDYRGHDGRGERFRY
jgi:hypothetical protein